MDPQWTLKERRQPKRCSLCHDDLGQATLESLQVECPRCHSFMHEDCLFEAGGCPSLGCEGLRFKKLRPAMRGRLLIDDMEGASSLRSFSQQGRVVDRRLVRQNSFRRLLCFLGLSVDDVVNSRQAKRRVSNFFKIQRASDRRGETQRSQVEDDYKQWLEDRL